MSQYLLQSFTPSPLVHTRLNKMTLFSSYTFTYICMLIQTNTKRDCETTCHLSLIITNMQNIYTTLSTFSHNKNSNIYSLYFIGAEEICQVRNLAKPCPSFPILTAEQHYLSCSTKYTTSCCSQVVLQVCHLLFWTREAW